MIVKVTTFNIACMLSIFSKLRPPKERQEEIANYLIDKHHDIYCLQEDFDNRTRRYIQQKMESFGYNCAHSKGRWGFLLLNGGTTIFSKHPILEINWKTFKNLMGEDWFGNKGILHTKISIEGKIVDVFGTHFQATPKYNCCNQSKVLIQQKELYDMKEFMQKHRSVGTVAIMALGDFNIRGDSEMKTKLFEVLHSQDTFEQDLNTPSAIWKHKIDYVFITPVFDSSTSIKKEDEFTDSSITFSDHYPVTLSIDIENTYD